MEAKMNGPHDDAENGAEAAPSFAERFMQAVEEEYKKLRTSNESLALRTHFRGPDSKQHRVREDHPCDTFVRDLQLRAHAAHVVFNHMTEGLSGSTEDRHQREKLAKILDFFDRLADSFHVPLDVNDHREKYGDAAAVINAELTAIFEKFTREILKESPPS